MSRRRLLPARARVSILAWTAFLLIGSCQHCPAQSTEQLPDFYSYEVVAEYAHDSRAFTQGTIRWLCTP
jgi:glutamine cyclotransferase